MNKIQQYKKSRIFQEYNTILSNLDSKKIEISNPEIINEYHSALDKISLIARTPPKYEDYLEILNDFLTNEISSSKVEFLTCYRGYRMPLNQIDKSIIPHCLKNFQTLDFVVGNYQESKILAFCEVEDGFLIE